MTITLNGTTGITLPNGSASTPAETGADTDSGVFYGTNTVSIATGGTAVITVDSSQNVGIGTTSPLFKLSTLGNANIGNNDSSNPLNYLRFGATQYGAADIRPTDEGSHKVGLSFYTDGTSDTTINPTERMRIDSSGKLNIGATTYSQGYNGYLLMLGGNNSPMIKFQATSHAWDEYHDGSSGRLYFAYDASDKAYVTTAGAWTQLSDQRAKKDIEDISYGLNEVMQLRPVTYRMNEDAETSKKNLGFIAQEVKIVIDEAVDDLENPEDMYGLDKSGLIPVLVKAIQEQQAIITDLKARIETLENK